MSKMKSVLYVHINNDFSGASYAMKAIIDEHRVCRWKLMTSYRNIGFLTDIEEQNIIDIPYKFAGRNLNTIFHLLRYWIVSSYYGFKLIGSNDIDIVYLNAISPWNMAIIGRIFNKKVIYHVHEFYEKPNILVAFYLFIMNRSADNVVFVSKDLYNRYKIICTKSLMSNAKVEYTPIRYRTLTEEEVNPDIKFNGHIMMVCSPRAYKGVELFRDLAENMPNKTFRLYLSGEYIFHKPIPSNLLLSFGKSNLRSDYASASIVLNLSQYPQWIETFGLTLWEGLSQGTPVIGPDKGGTTEIITNECGRLVDTTNLLKVKNAVNLILASKQNYVQWVFAALKQSRILESKYKIKLHE